jgi:hypothetical protein
MKLLKQIVCMMSVIIFDCIGMEQNGAIPLIAQVSKDDARELRVLAISLQACSQVRSHSNHFYPGAWHPEQQTLGDLQQSCDIIAERFNLLIARHYQPDEHQ